MRGFGDGGTGNFNAVVLIGEFVALRDEPGCLVQNWRDILSKEFCADKQTRKWSLNSKHTSTQQLVSNVCHIANCQQLG